MARIAYIALLLALVSVKVSAAIDVTSTSDSWAAVLVGSGFDPGGDTQATAAVDLTGFDTTPLFYMKYDDGGTPGDASDDEVAFRFRADNAVDQKGDFSGYIWIGLDVDLDNDIDAFMMLVGKNGAYSLDVYDAGTGSNTSPSTTDINGASQIPVTTGFAFNHSLVQAIDATGIADQDADGNPDYLVSYKVNFNALAAGLNGLTLTGSTDTIQTLNGGVGMTIDTPFQLVVASAQNAQTLNGDIGGYNDKTDDLTFTYSAQGAFSSIISYSEPTPVDSTPPIAPTVASQTTANTQPSITGTFDSTDAAGGFTVAVDGVTYTHGVDAALTSSGDNWTLDLSLSAQTLTNNTYDVVATATDGAGNSRSDATSGELTVNTAAPASPTVESQVSNTNQPTISGTFDSANAAGFSVKVGGVTYTLGVDAALSNSGGSWTLDLSQTAQTLPDGSYDVVATITDGAANSSSDATINELVVDTTAPVTPTVTSLVTNNHSPIIGGTFDSSDMAGGSVVVDGWVYTLGNPALVVLGNNWSVNLSTSGQVLADGYFDVVATAIDAAGNSSSDLTSNEVLIDSVAPTAPTVNALFTSDTTPTLSGTFDASDYATFTVTVNGITYTLGDGNLSNSGNDWTLVIPAPNALAMGSYEVVATAGDSVGNSSSDSSSNELSVEEDSDGDGIPNSLDLDDDNDGIPDSDEGDGLVDTDGDSIPDSLDLDSDNDGLYDLTESGIGNAAALDGNNDGRIDGTGGANGLADSVETSADSGSINYTIADTDGDGVRDFRDRDSDNDGIHDVIEAGGSDADGDGIIGSGVPPVDVAGIPVGGPLAPLNSDGDGLPDYRDLDSDNDGIYDVTEAGGSDGDNDGIIGTGTPAVNSTTGIPAGGSLVPTDSNGDGTPDYLDNSDNDGDGIPDTTDLDDDNDGIPDSVEGDGAVDTDGDLIPDSLDLDSDNDGLYDLIESGIEDAAALDGNSDGRIDGTGGANGLADSVETSADSGSINYTIADTDGDLVEDFRDRDADNDGINDVTESGGSDDDGDGVLGSGPVSVNGDGIPSGGPLAANDKEGDGVANFRDLDSDNDGLYDVIEADGSDANGDGRLGDTLPVVVDPFGIPSGGGLIPPNTDGDTVPDYLDLDSDNDGIPDVTEAGGDDPDGDGTIGSGTPSINGDGVPGGAPLLPADTDNDGVDDYRDLDADGDGINDLIETGGNDANGDGTVDGFTDSDGNGFDDGLSVSPLPTPDSDGDGIPDFQDRDDIDNDGIPDFFDLDDDNDGIPDTLEGDGLVDTDGDGVPDSRDLDSDNDGIFDLAESGVDHALLLHLDSDNDGRIDDSNGVGANGLADAVETATDSGTVSYNGGVPVDSDGDGVADFRDLDSDNDGITDVLENGGSDPDGDGVIGSGAPPQVNGDGVAVGGSSEARDTDGDGTPDYLDLDSDNDGEFDVAEVGGRDDDGDGRVDNFTDSNGDGFDDATTASPPVVVDANQNGVLDYLEESGVITTGLAGLGGCTIGRNAPFDPLLPIMVAISLLALRRRTTAVSDGGRRS